MFFCWVFWLHASDKIVFPDAAHQASGGNCGFVSTISSMIAESLTGCRLPGRKHDPVINALLNRQWYCPIFIQVSSSVQRG